jgi:hypothetical protein
MASRLRTISLFDAAFWIFFLSFYLFGFLLETYDNVYFSVGFSVFFVGTYGGEAVLMSCILGSTL